MAFIDTTEQQITSPKDKRKRKMYCLGKKKKHTVKNLYMVNKDEIIFHKTKHKQKGKRHDYRIYKKNHHDTPKEVESIFDLGFLGVEKDYPEKISSLPIKKKRNHKELTLEEKEYNNRIHSKKKRIVAEHAICRLSIE